jgi:ATP-dependent protease Clp ATPase subunit
MQVLTTTPLSPHRFVIGQDEAKRALSVAVCDHYNFARRCLAEPALAETHHVKPNVLLLGPSGVG